MERFGAENGPVGDFMYTVMNCQFLSVAENVLNIRQITVVNKANLLNNFF